MGEVCVGCFGNVWLADIKYALPWLLKHYNNYTFIKVLTRRLYRAFDILMYVPVQDKNTKRIGLKYC